MMKNFRRDHCHPSVVVLGPKTICQSKKTPQIWMTKKGGNLAMVVILLLCISECKTVGSRADKVNYRQKEKQVLDSILGKGYDKRIRPSGKNDTDGPATISVNIYLRTISRIDDVKMEYSVQVTFREQWNDERLIYFDDTNGRLKYLTLTDPTKVWMPDTFFRNEKEARKHEIIVPNVYVRIFPNGEILYSIRISLTLACPMDLRLYPLDKQVCVLQIASYGWAKDDLIYKWKEKDPVQVVPGLHLPRFTLEQYKSAYCDVITNTGEYSCLKVELIFKREFSYYLITIYVPCCMLVIVSWVSFWLDQNAIPARVSLGVTTLLTMSTQTSGINAQLPPVSYTKAIDVWTGVCQCFVFCALLEFALVNYASRSDMQRDRAKERMERACRHWEMQKQSKDRKHLTSCNTTPANHSSSCNTGDPEDTGMPSLSMKKRNEVMRQNSATTFNFPTVESGYDNNRPPTATTNYPYPYSRTPDYFGTSSADFIGGLQSMEDSNDATGSMAYMMEQTPVTSSRMCEVHSQNRHRHHMHLDGGLGGFGVRARGRYEGMWQQWVLLHLLQPLYETLFFCCRTEGLLSKFPSRAKRIDVLSRFIFPLIFAIFNLAYWLYYLLAKSKFPSL